MERRWIIVYKRRQYVFELQRLISSKVLPEHNNGFATYIYYYIIKSRKASLTNKFSAHLKIKYRLNFHSFRHKALHYNYSNDYFFSNLIPV